MAKLIRTEPSLFNPSEHWLIFDDGRKCLRKREPVARVEHGLTIMSDHISPIKSMADGNIYDSKSALYRSYRADGNPQGIAYECVGNAEIHHFTKPKRDKGKSIEAIKRAMGDL